MNQEFIRELTQLIRKYSIDEEAGTPDCVLAQHAALSLQSFATTLKARMSHYGRKGGSVTGPTKIRPRQSYVDLANRRYAKQRAALVP